MSTLKSKTNKMSHIYIYMVNLCPICFFLLFPSNVGLHVAPAPDHAAFHAIVVVPHAIAAVGQTSNHRLPNPTAPHTPTPHLHNRAETKRQVWSFLLSSIYSAIRKVCAIHLTTDKDTQVHTQSVSVLRLIFLFGFLDFKGHHDMCGILSNSHQPPHIYWSNQQTIFHFCRVDCFLLYRTGIVF